MNVYGRWLLFRGRVQKKELLLLIVMDGVTSETTGLWACVLIAAEILVAGCAMGAHDGRSGVAKTKYFRGIAIAVDVCAARTVTSFAALLFWLVLSKQLLVARLQDAGEEFVMTRLAGLSADVAGNLPLTGESAGHG
jgi:hypothetical protein